MSVPGEIPTYSLETEASQRAIAIQQAASNGVALLKNPVTEVFSIFDHGVGTLQSKVTAAMTMVDATAFANLSTLQSTLTGVAAAGAGLFGHTQSLLFGDDEGSIISGGFQSNLAQANSANTLFNTTSGVEATCDLFEQFFGSIKGAAQALFNTAQALIDTAMAAVERLMGLVTGVIEVVVGTIQEAINAVMETINQAITMITGTINEMVDLVQREIQAFTDWMQRQIDLALGNFLSVFKNIPCIGGLVDQVQTPDLDDLLNGALPV